MDFKTKKQIQILYDYMKLNDSLEKVDIIIGCGCANLKIPKRCAELHLQGYADYIIFTGGLGKTTKELFHKSEAEMFCDVAMECGVDRNKIYLENQSTNLPQNFMNCNTLIREVGLTANSLLLVHSPSTTRRTLATAKVYFPDKRILITTPNYTFESFMKQLEESPLLTESICVLVGNIQRMIVVPPIRISSGSRRITRRSNTILLCTKAKRI